ncbi:MAG: HemK family protein methyltransferase [Minisyncoccia bacterium]
MFVEKPDAYKKGNIQFNNNFIDLSYHPLIPRVETEFWVQKAIQFLQKNKFDKLPLKCLDLFSGSGCIGISILKKLPNSFVVFSDKNSLCIKQIKLNLKLNYIQKNRFQVIKSDIFSNIKRKFNVIFANPPYIAEKFLERVQDSVLYWEPLDAILGGWDGTEIIKKFLIQARNHLEKNGIIFLEFDSEQKQIIKTFIQKNKYKKFYFLKDQFGNDRYVKIIY